jgi:hypothetical protein
MASTAQYFSEPPNTFKGRFSLRRCLESLKKKGLVEIVPLWTLDCGRGGYLSGGLDTMVKKIKAAPDEERRYFEVIQPNRLCKLFFDLDCKELEFASRLPAFEKALSDAVAAEAAENWGFTAGTPAVVISDATTKKKLSRHYLYPGYVFETVDEGGGRGMRPFAKAVRARLLNAYPEMEEWLDMAVYTPNRNWRLTHCRKKQTNKWRPVANLKIVAPAFLASASFEEQLVKSMVTTCVEPGVKIPEEFEAIGKLLLVVHDVVSRTPEAAKSASAYAALRGAVSLPDDKVELGRQIEAKVLRALHPLRGSEELLVDQRWRNGKFDFRVKPSFPCPNKMLGGKPQSHKSNCSFFVATEPNQRGQISVTLVCCDPLCVEKGNHVRGPMCYYLPQKKAKTSE